MDCVSEPCVASQLFRVQTLGNTENKKNTAFCRVVLFWRTYSFSLKNNAPEGFARSALPTLCGNRNDFGALYFRNLLLVEPCVASQLCRVLILGCTKQIKNTAFCRVVLFWRTQKDCNSHTTFVVWAPFNCVSEPCVASQLCRVLILGCTKQIKNTAFCRVVLFWRTQKDSNPQSSDP